MDIYYGDLKISDSKSFTDRVLEILKEEYNMDIKSFGIRNPENFVLPVFESNGEVVKHRIEDGVYKGDYVDISGREEFKSFDVDITGEQAVFTPTDESLAWYKDYAKAGTSEDTFDSPEDFYDDRFEDEEAQEAVYEMENDLTFDERDLCEFLAQERAFGVVNAALDINRGLTEAAVRQVCGNNGAVLTFGTNRVSGGMDVALEAFRGVFTTDFSSLKDVSEEYHGDVHTAKFDITTKLFTIPEEAPSMCYTCNDGKVGMCPAENMSKDYLLGKNLLEDLGVGKIYADKLGASVPAKVDKLITDSFKFEDLMNRMYMSVDDGCTQTEQVMAHGYVPTPPGKSYAIPMNFVKNMFQMGSEPIKLNDNPLKYPVSMRPDDFGNDLVVETYADKHVRTCPFEFRADSTFFKKRQENTVESDTFKAMLDKFVSLKSAGLDGTVPSHLREDVKLLDGFEDSKEAFDFKYRVENLIQTEDVDIDYFDKTPVDD